MNAIDKSSNLRVLETLHPGIQRCIKEKGWKGLSDIQGHAIPAILSGEDCVIEAPTAGGKTEAVLFPTLTRAASSTGEGVRILYLAPLRALLNNLDIRAQEYAQACGIHAFKWHGDVSQTDKLDALSQPPELLLTTPESVEAMLLRKPGWAKFLGDLQAIIIDEAHSFALGDRGGHVVSLLERIEAGTGGKAQRIAITATVGNPDEMLTWLAGMRRPPGRSVKVAGIPPQHDFEVKLFVEAVDDADEVAPRSSAEYQRFLALQDTVRGNRSLVFVGSRKKSENIAKAFVKSQEHVRGKRIEVRTHHSAVSKFFREDAERLIQVATEGGIDAIISTSTLELGIDIGELDRVVQIGCLSSPSSLVQRVGRTGRRKGKPQFFRGFTVKDEDLLLLVATVNLALRMKLEKIPFPRRPFHLLVHQLLCLSLQAHGIETDRAWQILSGAACFSEVSLEEFLLLVEHMKEEGYLRSDDSVLLVGPKAEDRFLRGNWRSLFAVFNTAPLYDVHDHKAHVGTLDVGFVETLETPFYFALAGKLWKAVAVDRKSRIVRAERTKEGTAPSWPSFGGPDVPFETAQEVGELLMREDIPEFLNSDGREALANERHRCSEVGWRVGEVALADRGASTIVATYAGDRINRTLAKLLSRHGLGSVTADYRYVVIKRKRTTSAADVRKALVEAASDVGSTRQAEVALGSSFRMFPFSPFAQCLPRQLWTAAFLEQRLDTTGANRVLRTAEMRIAQP